jgi:predicted nucleic acid-binding protein
MAARIKVLIDLNILLDVLQRREEFYAVSARVLSLVEAGRIDGMVAAHSLTTLFYLMARYRNTEQARLMLTQLLVFLSVATVDQAVIEGALNLPYRDFEDAVQMMAALHAGAAYLVTRNPLDFKAGPITALQPAELLALIQDSPN